jgi:SAM-dependent methyltransferase
MRTWLAGHGCRPVDVAPRQATDLAFEDESFDAALLIGALGQLEDVGRAAVELRRVLRPGGVLLVSAANRSYWRNRLDRAARAGGRGAGAVSPGSLRRLLLEGGFTGGRLQPGRCRGPGRGAHARPAYGRRYIDVRHFRTLRLIGKTAHRAELAVKRFLYRSCGRLRTLSAPARSPLAIARAARLRFARFPGGYHQPVGNLADQVELLRANTGPISLHLQGGIRC